MKDVSKKPPAFWQAAIPVIALVAFLVVQIRVFGGTAHLPLILASVVGAWVGLSFGVSLPMTAGAIVSGGLDSGQRRHPCNPMTPAHARKPTDASIAASGTPTNAATTLQSRSGSAPA